MSNVSELLDAILSGNSLEAINSFEDAIGEKVADAIDEKKAEVTESMFGESVEMSFEELAEEVMALDEISKKTLGNYINKASKNAADLNAFAHTAAKDAKDASDKGGHWRSLADIHGQASEHNLKKANKRFTGIEKAVSKLTKEELEIITDLLEDHTEEQINQIAEELVTELSNGTLKNYVNKSADDLSNSSHVAGSTKSPEAKEYHGHKAIKRLAGIRKATKKLAKEQAEQVEAILEDIETDIIANELVNEISKGTLGSYIKKASSDAAMRMGTSVAYGKDSQELKNANMKLMSHSLAKSSAAENDKAHKRLQGIRTATNKLTKEQAEQVEAVLDELNENVIINEGVNDHEELHKTIIKKLHKHLPELGLKGAVHTGKRLGRDDEEVHTYSVKHVIPPSLKHSFANHTSDVEITHTKEGGKPWVHARVSQNWEHHGGGRNGHTIGALSHDHPKEPGKTHFRNYGNNVVKEI